MPHIRLPSRWPFVLAVGLALSASSWALGIGGLPSGATLGQPLDFSFTVRLEAGETLEPRCIAAEVMIGERRLPAVSVRTGIVRQSAETVVVRLQTIVPVDEPLVDISLGAGCAARVTRRFVLFPDPPAVAATPAAPPLAAPADLAVAGPATLPATAAPAVAAAASPSTPPVPVAATAPAAPAASAPVPTTATATATATAAATATARATATSPAPAPAARARAARSSAPQAAAPSRPSRENASAQARREAAVARKPVSATPPREAARQAPRLKLDVLEARPQQPVLPSAAVVEEAIAAVQAAASAARAAAAAASQSAARVQVLEQDMARLQQEARARDAEAAELRKRVAAAERASDLTAPLMLAAAVLLGLVLWLAWRLRALQHERERSWREAADAAISAQAPDFVGPPIDVSASAPLELRDVDASEEGRRPGGARPAPAPTDDFDPFATGSPLLDGSSTLPAEQPVERTQMLPPVPGPAADVARDVSIEELIDLEQQADFFAVLGQDGAAIDLLVEHLRQSGGGSPLPYLKLLEIYRRRNERREYERIRDRFNDRFNAYAPDWASDLQHGRSLKDYAGVLRRLQGVWARPLDAMAELEALLFSRSRGELFELPAYRDVLMLYAVARDLHQREGGAPPDIDLLLPLPDGGEFSSTAATPLSQFDAGPGGRATRSLDLDLDLSLSDDPPAGGTPRRST